LNFKPLTGLSKALRVLLKISIVFSAVTVLVDIYNYYSYSQLPANADLTETVLSFELLTGLIYLVQSVLFIVLAIIFLRWIYRTNKNLHVLSSWRMRFTPGWAVGWYFIPIANLFKPYQTMKEIWQVSHSDDDPGHHLLVILWWFVWIISIVANRYAFKLGKGVGDAASYASSAASNITSDAIGVLLNIVALMLVSRIWTAYSQNFVEPEGALDGGTVGTLPPPLPVKKSITIAIVLGICGGFVKLLFIVGIFAAIAVPRYTELEESAKLYAIDAAVSELNGREGLYWADEKISGNGWTSDTGLINLIDYDLGNDFSWPHGLPAVGGRDLQFQDLTASLTRVQSTFSEPAVWSREQ
jgi:hypothetical protein